MLYCCRIRSIFISANGQFNEKKFSHFAVQSNNVSQKKKVKNPNNTLKQKDKVDCIALWDTVFNNVLCCILVTVSNVAGHPGILFI